VGLRHAIDDRGVLHIDDEVGLRRNERRRAGVLEAAHVRGTEPAVHEHQYRRFFDDGSDAGHGRMRSASGVGKNRAAAGNTNQASFESEDVMPTFYRLP
jgi:hypothetical protein